MLVEHAPHGVIVRWKPVERPHHAIVERRHVDIAQRNVAEEARRRNEKRDLALSVVRGSSDARQRGVVDVGRRTPERRCVDAHHRPVFDDSSR